MRKIVPLTDIIERDNEYIIISDLPGATKDTLSIDIDKNILTFKSAVNLNGDLKVIYREFEDSFEYERSFRLGNDIDHDGIKAKLENGVLAIVLPKSEKAKPKKIKIE
ncbi:MAG TPA: Hsp20/alpha crystallin family protein [Spirochaetota bacterium]|nr:Hsp20/alpha crystallin family protein [Spirochaetota bacterium]HOM38791.1 Hsp20/alpha crystallin family protein [Spirochaetota bacterium]HPQ49849.1 Hsp20/alpha crystallin family protein [Spirochaetota bacterium]